MNQVFKTIYTSLPWEEREWNTVLIDHHLLRRPPCQFFFQVADPDVTLYSLVFYEPGFKTIYTSLPRGEREWNTVLINHHLLCRPPSQNKFCILVADPDVKLYSLVFYEPGFQNRLYESASRGEGMKHSFIDHHLLHRPPSQNKLCILVADPNVKLYSLVFYEPVFQNHLYASASRGGQIKHSFDWPSSPSQTPRVRINVVFWLQIPMWNYIH